MSRVFRVSYLVVLMILLSSIDLYALTPSEYRFEMAIEPAVERVEHGRFFATSGRKISVVGNDPNVVSYLSNTLAEHGAIVVGDFFSKLFAPKLLIKPVNTIDDSADAFAIHVGRSKIEIRYTNPQMMERALREFCALLEDPYGQRIIRGVDLYCVSQSKATTRSLVRNNKAGVVDGVTKVLSVAQVESAINSQLRLGGRSNFIFAIVNKQIFRYEFDVFKGINAGRAAICAAGGGYSAEQIRRMVVASNQAGGEFVIAVDMLSDNEVFEAYTGHKMSSVEGMRFVRAIIEECGRSLGVKKICIGRQSNIASQPLFYTEFLDDIASREGLVLITI